MSNLSVLVSFCPSETTFRIRFQTEILSIFGVKTALRGCLTVEFSCGGTMDPLLRTEPSCSYIRVWSSVVFDGLTKQGDSHYVGSFMGIVNLSDFATFF